MSILLGGLGPGKWYHSQGPYDGYRNFECVLFYVDGLYREKVVFEIEYEMYNAALRYADASELYMSIYSGNSIEYLDSLKGEILIPNASMPKPGNYDFYTYGTNSHDFPFTESITANPGYHTFSFSLNKSQLRFMPYNKYIEFALISHGDDCHSFTKYASFNNYYNTNMLDKINKAQADYEALPGIYGIAKIIVFLLLSIIAFFIIKIIILYNEKIKIRNNFYEPEMQMDYFRDIPSELDPSFARELVFSKHASTDNIKDGYAATMLSLVRKGYIDVAKIKEER